jgi:hypothetical protein
MPLKVKTRTIDNQTALEVWEIGGKLLFKKYVDSPIHAPTDTLSVGMPDKLSCAVRRLKRRTVADLPDAEVERKYRELRTFKDLRAMTREFQLRIFC